MATMKNVNLTLAASRQPFRPELPLAVGCAACGTTLDVHQPDLGRPDRLLGICEDCGAWYLMSCRVDRFDTVVLQLPEDDTITKAVGRLRITLPPGEKS